MEDSEKLEILKDRIEFLEAELSLLKASSAKAPREAQPFAPAQQKPQRYTFEEWAKKKGLKNYDG